MNARERARIRARIQVDLLRARLMRWVEVDAASGCWLYQGHKHHTGYGRITVRMPGRKNPVPMAAHRVAYWVFKRRPPLNRHIAHSYKCVSLLCINPEHLRATTQSSNERDKKRATRWRLRTLPNIDAVTHDLGVRPHAQRPKPAARLPAAEDESVARCPF